MEVLHQRYLPIAVFAESDDSDGEMIEDVANCIEQKPENERQKLFSNINRMFIE